MNKKQTRDDDPQPPSADAISCFVDSSDDLALELAIYRAFRDSGWGANYGHFYWDPILEKPRQFDVQGRKDLQKNPSTPTLPTTGIRIAAECKNVDPNRPVIVSRVPRAESESYHCLIWRTLQASIGEPATVRVIKSSERDSKPISRRCAGRQIDRSIFSQGKGQRQGQTGGRPLCKVVPITGIVRVAGEAGLSGRIVVPERAGSMFYHAGTGSRGRGSLDS
jgi:hypothetical protein